MLELRRELNLSLEPFDGDALRELGRQHFDDDFAPERRLRRDEYARHAAAPELTVEPVGPSEACLQAVSELGHACRSRRIAKRNVGEAQTRNQRA